MGSLGRKAVWGAAVALWILVPAPAASAADRQGKLDKLLQNASSGAPRSVIIRVAPDGKDRIQKRLPHRGRGPAEHRFISALTAELDATEIAGLVSDPDVLSVSADAVVHASTSGSKAASGTLQTGGSWASTPDFNPTTGSTGTAPVSVIQRALGLQNWFTGSTATVAVIDSGLQDGADFSNRIVGFYDFTAGRGPVASTPIDDFGHGTHVAGLIGSSGVSSSGKYAGVAPGIKLLALKVLDKKGLGRTSDVISALEFAVANKDRFGIRVVNLSLGHAIYESGASDPLVQAVEAAVQSGLIVVAAAGNYGVNRTTGFEGYAGITSPGNAPSAITVGASDTAGTDRRDDDRVASFSSRGPTWFDGIAKPDVVAPGINVVSNQVAGSTLATQYQSLVVREGSGKYLRLSGSSMATAVVSGLAALMVESNSYGAYHRRQQELGGAPALTANATKAILQYSATPLHGKDGTVYDPLAQGTGEVNGRGALLLSYSADTTRQAGTFWLADEWPPATEFGGVDQPWAQSIVWGTRIVRGSSLVEVNQTAWAANIVWGTGQMGNIVWGTLSEDDNIVWGTLLDGDNIVWGTALFLGNAQYAENIVWGTAAAWDDNIVWGTGLLGTFDGDNIVWGTLSDDADNIVWGTLSDDNIVWGTSDNTLTVSRTPNGGGR
jgi:serine protease AprX